jgi:hypothetical protein
VASRDAGEARRMRGGNSQGEERGGYGVAWLGEAAFEYHWKEGCVLSFRLRASSCIHACTTLISGRIFARERERERERERWLQRPQAARESHSDRILDNYGCQ